MVILGLLIFDTDITGSCFFDIYFNLKITYFQFQETSG